MIHEIVGSWHKLIVDLAGLPLRFILDGPLNYEGGGFTVELYVRLDVFRSCSRFTDYGNFYLVDCPDITNSFKIDLSMMIWNDRNQPVEIEWSLYSIGIDRGSDGEFSFSDSVVSKRESALKCHSSLKKVHSAN